MVVFLFAGGLSSIPCGKAGVNRLILVVSCRAVCELASLHATYHFTREGVAREVQLMPQQTCKRTAQ
jgi:hypothetical protein